MGRPPQVGTIGGGTGLPAQQSMLRLIGVDGAHPTAPGQNAATLPRPSPRGGGGGHNPQGRGANPPTLARGRGEPPTLQATGC